MLAARMNVNSSVAHRNCRIAFRYAVLALALCRVALFPGAAAAQDQASKFELISIREITGGVRNMGGFKSSGNRAEYQGFAVPALIAEAWKVRPDQIALAPDVAPGTVYPMMDAGRSARIYDIVALAP